MTTKEANIIIAEFMGEEHYYYLHPRYGGATTDGEYDICISDSLDALVPVWEKLKSFNLEFGTNVNSEYLCFYDTDRMNVGVSGHTIQEAAALATAKAIQELK